MAGACNQLAAEMRWLRGEISPGIAAALRTRSPPDRCTCIARQVEGLLQRSELAEFLAVLKQHNEARRTPFLLGPYLFQVISSIEGLRAAHAKMPALDQPAAEVRDHLLEASIKSKDLAARLRKGPQPSVVLARHSEAWDALGLIESLSTIQSSSERENVLPLDQLLEKAADLLETAANKIPRAKQHRRPSKSARAGNSELRSRAARVLVDAFRSRLGHAYHRHIATIAELLSGITTDADFVKKAEKRGRAARAPGDKLPGKIA